MTKKLLISILFSVFAFYAIADLQDNPCEHDEIVPDVPENKVETDCNFTLSLDYKGETTIYIPVNTGNPEVSPTLDGETGKVEIMGHCEDCEDAGFVDETIYHNLKYEWSSNDESGEDSSCSGITRDEIGSDSISFTVNCDDCGHSASSEPLTLEFYKIDLIAPDIEEENEDKDLGLVVSLNNNFDEGLLDTDGTTLLPDYSNEEMISTDKDLVKIELKTENFAGAPVGYLKLNYDNTKIRVFKSQTEIIEAGTDLFADMPSNIWIEAIKLDGGSTLSLNYEHGGEDSFKITPVKIESVEWENGDTAKEDYGVIESEDNSMTGGGKKIYPGAIHKLDENDRSKIRIKAKILPALKDIDVYFHVYDVDDPSASELPIDNETLTLTDNKGPSSPVGALYTYTAKTDENGIARIDFKVSKQPGDNYKAVAGLSEDYFTGIKSENTGRNDSRLLKNTTPLTGNNISEMLTVWRTLWIEIDSMKQPQDAGEEMQDDWDYIIIKGATTNEHGTTKLEVSWGDSEISEDCFEGGVIETHLGNYSVINNSETGLIFSDFTIDIAENLNASKIEELIDTLAVVKEEDELSSLNYSTSIPTFVNSALEKAYITPKRTIITLEYDFDNHTTLFNAIIMAHDIINSTENYWHQTVLNSFQGYRYEDGDSDGMGNLNGKVILCKTETPAGGYTPITFNYNTTNFSYIFLETLRDRDNGEHPSNQWGYGFVFAHEIGHAGRNDGVHKETNIMSTNRADNYGDETINIFRKKTIW